MICTEATKLELLIRLGAILRRGARLTLEFSCCSCPGLRACFHG